MSNLLKDASILLTPTGYDNGSMNAIKPGDGDGDFTFVRGSAATRVNAQGLVEDVQILSSNLVTNGDFSQKGLELIINGDFASDTAWGKLNATISDGLGNLNATGVLSLLFQTILTNTESYTATFTVLNYNGLGEARVVDSDDNTLYTITSNGTFTFNFTSSVAGGGFLFLGRNNAIYSVDNVSVKEIGQDWVFSTGATITDLGAKITHTPTPGSIAQSSVLVVGKNYKINYEITESVSGGLKLNNQAGLTTMVTSVGVHTKYFEANNSVLAIVRTNPTNNDVTITNISVKEITDDTNLPRINYDGFSFQDALGSELVTNGDFSTDSDWVKLNGSTISGGVGNVIANGRIASTLANWSLNQNVAMISGSTYKISFKARQTGGTDNFQLGQGFNIGFDQSITSSFVNYSFNITAINYGSNTGKLSIGGRTIGDTFEVDNVSVKEVLGQEVVPDSGSGAWLLEPQSTNRVINSAEGEYGNPPASSTNIISPDGTNNAYIPVPNAVADRYQQSIPAGTYATGQKLTYSWYRKRVSTPAGVSVTGDLEIKSLVNLTELEVNNARQIQTNINGFDRFEAVVEVIDGSLSSIFRAYFGPVVDVGNSSVAYWGHQFEALDFATSLIPTDGAISTRLQDQATNSGNATLINSTEGVFYVDIAALAATTTGDRRIVISNGTTTYRLIIRIIGPNTIQMFVGNNGSQASHIVTNVTTTSFNRMAISWKESDIKFYFNGINVSTKTISNPFPAGILDTIAFRDPSSGRAFYGENRTLAVYKEALTDANLRCLTYPDPVATTFDLNFKTIAEQFTFTRGSEATFVNEQGLIESTASNNAPRIDYSTGTEAFLLEPQSTNLIAYGEDFNDSYWSRTENTTVSLSNVLAPNGIDFAYKVSASTASAALFRVSYNPTNRLTDARSIYARTVSGTGQVRLCSFNQNTNNLFTLTEEWQRFEVNSVINTAANNFYAVDFRNGTTLTEVLIWGAQAEELPYATSYIPTSGATATRNQETCVDATPVINGAEGTLYAEISALFEGGSSRYISLSDGTTNNRVVIELDGAAGIIVARISVGGVTQVDSLLSITAVQTNYNKIAFKYKNNDFSVFLNGSEVFTDFSGSVFSSNTLNSLQFANGDGNLPFHGNTKDLKYYPKALADVQLEDLTKI